MEIKGYENYKITREGKVFNESGKELKQSRVGDRNYTVGLSKNGKCKKFQVNRLVAEHYIRHIEDNEMVVHKSGNKENNSVDDLKIMVDFYKLHNFKKQVET